MKTHVGPKLIKTTCWSGLTNIIFFTFLYSNSGACNLLLKYFILKVMQGLTKMLKSVCLSHDIFLF